MSKKPNAKSIVANFGALSSATNEAENSGTVSDTAPSRAVPRAGVIGAAQRSLGEIRQERDRLLAVVESGGAIQEIDPELIDPSPFADRLADDRSAEFEGFKRRFEAEGQQVAVHLRPHPAKDDRFQVIFGHRRCRAARELGVAVKAVVSPMSDTELVLAQGIENSDRQDLTWIERALFAFRMAEQNVRPRDIKAALSLDDTELAKMRRVYTIIPVELIELIGRAPKVGRPRWVALAKAIEGDRSSVKRILKTLAAAKVSTSDERFQIARQTASEKNENADQTGLLSLKGPSGDVIAKAAISSREIRMKLSDQYGQAFSDFIQAELPRLVERFNQEAGSEDRTETLAAAKVSSSTKPVSGTNNT
ncbi:plasmid partitioning protein RepB [Notoacmeibacter ruber]|uniref:Plasmid partitioning protein RepB n=1 Tax=Notoacmeibacter ruber TaxID=2670375 RepID=A0A3L7J658_9HYPH|nr:plasmid partitioning protein RepB [Notoacmeibacter ruber]RLQ84991.1 plasmid partitioning protein RepB [Notoacmeibacter ruber]